MTSRQLTSDVLTTAGLMAATYATPSRLRPALGLAVAVALSRTHGDAHRRDLIRLFAERNSVKRHLELTVDPELDRLAKRQDELVRGTRAQRRDHARRIDDLERHVARLEGRARPMA